MKSALIALALLGLVAAAAWYYFTNDAFQSVELPAIKRTASGLATLNENKEAQAKNRPTPQPPKPEEPRNEFPYLATFPPPTPAIPPRESATLVSRTIETGMEQRVDVTVEGFADNRLRFDQLVQTIDEEEHLLGVPFPAPKVNMRRVSRIPGGFCGENQTTYKPGFKGDPYTVEASVIRLRIDEDCNDTFVSIAHEVAHTWFHGNDPQNWIDEGLADSIEYQVKETHPEEAEEYPPVTYCASYRNIAELEAAKPISDASTPESGFTCNYTMGDGIFGALRQYLGTEAFNRRIAELGRRSVNATDRANSIEDVRKILGLDAKALEIIDLWYSGEPEMRIYRHLDLVTYSHPPTLDGEYLHFAGRVEEPGLIHDFILGDNPFCPQFYVYEGLADPEPLAGIADPMTVGWQYNEVPEIEAINSEINSATGEFRITARVNDRVLLMAKDLSLHVSSRVQSGQDGNCEESIDFSQVRIELGTIPDERKEIKHYHTDQITWDWPPQVNNYQIHLSGKAPPGSLSFQARDNYCGQIGLSRVDENGYHRIASVNSLLPAGQLWTTTPRAEITSGQVRSDGRFEATIEIWDASLLNHAHVVLEIDAESPLDRSTNQCAPSETMSAVTLQGK